MPGVGEPTWVPPLVFSITETKENRHGPRLLQTSSKLLCLVKLEALPLICLPDCKISVTEGVFTQPICCLGGALRPNSPEAGD
jgi:hypothetical protein